MKPRRPRRGQPGYRPRLAGGRVRLDSDRLQAFARRLDKRYSTKPGRKKEK